MPFSEIQSSELFVELSEEQQETVAGGFDGISLTQFSQRSTGFEMYSASGPGGSVTRLAAFSTIIDTSAFTAIFSKLREASSGVTNSRE
jgi:hypothetical protein